MAELVGTTCPGVLLPVGEVPLGSKVHEVSVEMLPLQQPEQVVNFADGFQTGWLSSENNLLRLQFQLVALYTNANTDGLVLSAQGEEKSIPLAPTRVASLVVGGKHPDIPWSGQSRFIIDEFISLPDWATNSSQFDLFARVAGKPERIAVIRIGGIFKNPKEENTNIAALTASRIIEPSFLVRVAQNFETKTAVSLPAVKALARGSNIALIAGEITTRIKRMNRLFLLTVALPTLVSGVYFGSIASDIYISESRFVVRSPQRQASTGLGALFQGAGFSRSQDDTYTVHDYIFSRDALKKLDEQFAVGKAFASGNVDIFSRFAGLDWDDSFEALHRYYQKRVTVDLDSASSITTLSVNAFTPEDAYQINEKLLELSENLVNKLNERGRQDMILFASAEVAVAEKKAKDAALAVSNYRNSKGVFDPDKQSALQLQQVSKLQDELTANKILLAQIRSFAGDNPQISSLKHRIETLQSEINSETAKVAGSNRSLSNKSAEYEGLILEQGFAEKQLAAALTSLEQARNDAQRKQLYLERIVQPNKPDMPMEPRRLRAILTTFVLGIISWGVLVILLAGVREHKD